MFFSFLFLWYWIYKNLNLMELILINLNCSYFKEVSMTVLYLSYLHPPPPHLQFLSFLFLFGHFAPLFILDDSEVVLGIWDWTRYHNTTSYLYWCSLQARDMIYKSNLNLSTIIVPFLFHLSYPVTFTRQTYQTQQNHMDTEWTCLACEADNLQSGSFKVHFPI